MTTNVSPLPGRSGEASAREPAAPSAAVPKSAMGRLVSLDVFRGFTMFWIVGGGGLMLGFQALGHNAVIDTVVHQLNHTPWAGGPRFYDCIWPCFMLMVGVSIPFSMAKRSLTQSYRRQLAHAILRTVIIFLLGSVRESQSLGTPYLVELSSALQPIALAYIVAFLVAKRSWQFQASLAGIILAVNAFLLAFVPAPGIPAGSYGFDHNLVHWIDMAVLSHHHWNIWPYRSEGWGTLLVMFPAIATTLFGLIIGGLLMTSRSMGKKAAIIGAMGVGFLIIGLGISPVIPIVMKMWTTSYAFASAGVACLEFLFFFWLVDIVRWRRWGIIFMPFGMNALFIYMAASLISFGGGTGVFTRPIAAHLGRAGLLFEAIVTLAVEWVILFWMMKRKIFVRV